MVRFVARAVIGGNPLKKVQCGFCGREYGSTNEARDCELKHVNNSIVEKMKENLENAGFNVVVEEPRK